MEARFNGGAWQTLGTYTGAFSATLTGQPQGQGNLEVRYLNDDASKVTVANVGIGEVFVVSGQSNAMGQGNNPQHYTHPTLKATKFSRASVWADCTDKVDSNGGTGSWMPPLATILLDELNIPVAFVPCGVDGSRIAAWQPGQANYTAMIARANLASTGRKVALWWQGEGDLADGTTKADYKTRLNALANGVMADLGVPLAVFLLQDCAGLDETLINEAISECIDENANIILGADLRGIATDDTYHLKSDAKQLLIADAVWAALQPVFYP